MFKARLLLMAMVTLNLIACSSFSPPWERYVPDDTNKSYVKKSYEINHSQSVTVGDSLISVDKGALETYYQPVLPNTVIWGGRSLSSFDRGSRTDLRKWKRKYYYNGSDGDYILTSQAFFKQSVGIIVNDDGSVPNNPVMRIDKKGTEERYPISSSSTQLFKKVTTWDDPDGVFRFELIYNGIEGTNVKLVYREYVGDLVRSSFFQNLTYDLDESNIITFKNIDLQIIEANNSIIKFTVLNDRNLNWLP